MDIESPVSVTDRQEPAGRTSTDQRLAELTLLNEIGRICSNSDNEDLLLAAVTRVLSTALYSDNCGFLLLDSERGVLVTHASFVLSDPNVSTAEQTLSTGIVGEVARSGLAQRVDDVSKHPAYLATDARTQSELCVPLISNKQVLGVLNIESARPAEFSATDERLMIAAVDLVANALSRIRSIEALSASEQRYRSILEVQTELICRFTPDCRLHWVNEAYARTVGMSRNELMGYSFLNFIPESERSQVRKFFAEFSPDNLVRSFEHSVHCATGVRWLQWTDRAFLDSSGKVVEFQGVARDITERKQAEQLLRKSETHYRLLFETCNDAIFLLDETGRIRSANPAAARMNGYSIDELLTMNIRDLDEPDSAARVPERMERLKRGETLEFSVRHRRRDGTTFPIEVVAKAIEIEGEWFVLSFDRDITRREMAEQALQRVARRTASSTGEKFYHTLVQQLSEALECKAAFLATLVGTDRASAKVIAARVDGHFLSEFEYELADTPCELVVNKGYCFHGSNVQQRYPRDHYLVDLNAESYLGIPLTASDGQVLGILAVLDEFPMVQSAEVDSVLEVFAQRAVVEIERSNSEQALCDSKTQLSNALERLELAVNGTSDGLWDWDINQQSVWISPRGLALMGIESATVPLSADDIQDLIQPDDVERVQIEFAAHLESGEPLDMEIRAKPRHGTLRWFRVRGKAIAEPRKRAKRMAGSIRDITDQKLSEQQLELTQHAVNVSADAVFFVRNDGSFSYVNDQACHYLGYTRAELLSMAVPDVDPDFSIDRFLQLWEQMKRERSLNFETLHRRKNGSIYECEIRTTFIAYGAHEFVVAMVRDISDRRRSEENLRHTTERLKEAQAIAKLGSFYYEIDSDRLTWSTELYRIFGLESESVASMADYLNRIADSDRDRVRAGMNHVIATGNDTTYECMIAASASRTIWIQARVTAVKDGSKRVVALQGTCQDITDRKESEQQRRSLEAQVLHAQKLESLGVLAGGIAHDFNNLLTAVLGYSDLALAHIPEESPARHMLGEIGGAARRATELTRQMLSYSGRGKFVVEEFRLDSVVRELTSLLQTVVSKKARFNLDLQPVSVEGDEAQLGQVIMNLVTNASEALCDENGDIRISTGVRTMDTEDFAGSLINSDLPSGEYAYLVVSDSGCGMTQETIARIFDPFYTTKFTGRGLGLAAVLGIVRSHSGTIAVESHPGEGTRFDVFLPAVKMSPIGEAVAPQPPTGGGGTVLLVEDDPSVLRFAKSVLESGGYHVLTAENGQSGLELFHKHSGEIAGLLVDLNMPRIDGIQLLERIRECSSVGVLIMSGFDGRDSTQRLNDFPACGFIEKPFQPDELIRKFHQVLVESIGTKHCPRYPLKVK